MKFYPVKSLNNFPKVYDFLSTTDSNSVSIMLPIYNWNSPNSHIELEREYYLTKNFRKTVNGYSGFSPFSWQDDVLYLFNNFPKNKEDINKLMALFKFKISMTLCIGRNMNIF